MIEMVYEKNRFSGKEVSRKGAFQKLEFRGKFVSREGGNVTPLNLPTAVQTPRSKNDGRYDADEDDDDPVNDVHAEYVPDPVTYDDATDHVQTEGIIADDVLC